MPEKTKSAKLPDKNVVEKVLQAIGQLLPFVPERYRQAASAALVFAVAMVGVIYSSIEFSPVENPGRTQQYEAVGLFLASESDTITYDAHLKVDVDNLKAETVEEAADAEVLSTTNDSNPHDHAAAPAMDWQIPDLREGKVHVVCMATLTGKNADALRAVLNDAAREMPVVQRSDGSFVGFQWREAGFSECPNAPYQAAETAHIDCKDGNNIPVACAVYTGERSGKISINPRFNNMPSTQVSWAHEANHRFFNRDHNPCGQIFDPENGQPVPSVMTGIEVSTGRSCSNPQASTFVRDDISTVFGEINYPTEAPPIQPPSESKQRSGQIWIERNRVSQCNPPLYDDGTWCIGPAQPVGDSSFYIALIDSAGNYDFREFTP